MTFQKLRESTISGLEDEASRAAEIYNLFIAGPYIDIEKPKNHKDNSSSESKKIRYHLYQHYSNSGINIYLGEDVELRKIGYKQYGVHSNAVMYERHYIKNHIDGVILFPSSPGSFCETGDWISDPVICARMLVIIDESHEGKKKYINDGVVKFAKFNGSDVLYLNYKNIEKIKSEVDKFLKK